MKLCFISDTHASHHRLPNLGRGDVLVHCGDFTARGTLEDTEDFAQFMAVQDFEYKVVIAGNHDRCFEDHRREAAEACLQSHGLIYLNDSGVTINGIKFWGSPVQPEFFNWAFNRQRGREIDQHWQQIPEDTDILLTHGPAACVLDRCTNGFSAGCEDLMQAIQRIKPRIHACGHIHEAYGCLEYGDTSFINACIMDEHYQLVNAPIRFDW